MAYSVAYFASQLLQLEELERVGCDTAGDSLDSARVIWCGDGGSGHQLSGGSKAVVIFLVCAVVAR